MTDIYVELGGKKAIAWSLEWPGWCRIRTSEATALQALLETQGRYRLIAQRAGLDFAPGDTAHHVTGNPSARGECFTARCGFAGSGP